MNPATRRKRATSLADIAKAAGVTSATVSRVLNNRTKGFSVRPEIRQRILSAAREMHYRPDLMAQSLRKADMGVVGLLGMLMPMVLPDRAIRGLVSVLEQHSIKLTTYFAASMDKSHDLPPWRIDGAILVGALSRDDLKAVEHAQIPYVSINGWCGQNGLAVMYDDVDGTEQAVEHLIRLGHRRIAYGNAFSLLSTHPSVRQRHQTYLACLRRHGLKPVPLHDVEMPERPVDYVREVIKEHGATAILAYHHFAAVSILQVAQEMGLSVPRDLSLVCFNDEYPIQFLNPPLTAVALPVREAGETAGRMLWELMHGKNPEERRIVTLKERLVERASTAPPRVA